MNTHPINNSGGKYSNPVVPANPAAQRPQQRTGPIIVGATTTSTTVTPAAAPKGAATSSTATSSANAPATSNAGNVSGNKIYPIGRYANETLSILRRAYAAPTSGCGNNKRPRVEDCANILDRLVHPLFLRANDDNIKINSHDQYGDDGEIGNETKRRRGDGELGIGENDDDSDQRDVVASNRAEYHSQLRAELERYKKENLRLVKRRENVFKSLVALHELYETGLDGIARSADLRFVPDNVMPDNIPK